MIGIIIHEEVEDTEAVVDLLNHIATKVKEGYTSGYHPGWELKGETGIECGCNDSACKKQGPEGEVAGHIEECPCDRCHREMGKVSG